VITVTSWAMPWGQLQWLKDYDSALARKFFDTPASFVVGNNPFPGPPPHWATKVLTMFKSHAAYARALAAGQLPRGSWVCYDNEHWDGTPMIEQQKPKAFMNAFASDAHAWGHKLVAAPSRDLIYVPGCDDPWKWPEKINDGWLRCGIPGGARDAEVLVCQAQGSEKDLDAYAALLAGAANQQPVGQVLWSELTTNFATADQMFMAYQEVAVAGFWVNILTQDQAPVGADFFRQVAATL
jgi:hypothetical protein